MNNVSTILADVVAHEHTNLDSLPFRYGFSYPRTTQIELFNCQNHKWQIEDIRFEVDADFVTPAGNRESGHFIIMFTQHKNPKVVTTNLDGTPSGKIKVMFDVGEGQTTGFEVANALEAEAVINSSENFSANLETFLEDQTKYRKYISDQSAKDVDTDIKDIKNSYDKVTKDIVSKKVEIGRLQKLVLQNPDSERYDKETDSIIKYNS